MSAILDKLLKGQKVEWKTLGDVSVLYGGLTGKNKADFENGNAKYVSYKNIFANFNQSLIDCVKIVNSFKYLRCSYEYFIFRFRRYSN